jgi:hypothetical protein
MFVETLVNTKYSTHLTPESRSYTSNFSRKNLRTRDNKLFQLVICNALSFHEIRFCLLHMISESSAPLSKNLTSRNAMLFIRKDAFLVAAKLFILNFI